MYLSYLRAATIKQHVDEIFKVSALVPMLWSLKRPSAIWGMGPWQHRIVTPGVVTMKWLPYQEHQRL